MLGFRTFLLFLTRSKWIDIMPPLSGFVTEQTDLIVFSTMKTHLLVFTNYRLRMVLKVKYFFLYSQYIFE